MNKICCFLLVMISCQDGFSQKVLTSWSQQNIENYTKEMYDEAQQMTAAQLLEKNKSDVFWSEVFLTLNASINHHAKDTAYLKELHPKMQNGEQIFGWQMAEIWCGMMGRKFMK